MSDVANQTILRRDYHVVLVTFMTLTMLAWGYVLWHSGHIAAPSADMSAPAIEMPAMDMGAPMTPSIEPVTVATFLSTITMWIVMMVGMMTPAAAPMFLLYAEVTRQEEWEGKPFTATGWFAAGYFLAWTAFSFSASSAQAALSNAGLLTPMGGTSDLLGGLFLVGAGAYQWSQLKNACLSQCRAPFYFIQGGSGFKRDAMGSIALGLQHGVYCVGCCWVLMLLLFVGGVMNVLWIAGLSILILLERLLPGGLIVSRVIGCILILGGTDLLYRGLISLA